MALDFPNSPVTGATYSAGPGGATWVWDGTKWMPGPQTPSLVTVSVTAPSSPTPGTLWYDLNGGLLYCFVNDGNSSQWVVANPNSSGVVGPQGPTGPAGSIGPSGPVGGVNPNKLINPFHEIDQANEGNAVTATNAVVYPVDGLIANWTCSTGAATAARQSTGPTGYPYSSVLHANTAASSLAANDLVQMQHRIEQSDLIDTGWGTTAATPLTLQFWAMDTIGGTRNAALYNTALTRLFVAAFQCTAGVWQLHTITIPGDTVGPWVLGGNAIGMYMMWVLAAGGARQGAVPNVWQTVSSNTLYAASLDNAFALTPGGNAWFYLGPYKLEVGTTATPILRESFDRDLARCQRRYEKSYDLGIRPGTANSGGAWLGGTFGLEAGNAYGWVSPIPFKTSKRAKPTMQTYDMAGAAGCASYYTTVWNNGWTNQNFAYAYLNGALWQTPGQAAYYSFEWTADSRL